MSRNLRQQARGIIFAAFHENLDKKGYRKSGTIFLSKREISTHGHNSRTTTGAEEDEAEAFLSLFNDILHTFQIKRTSFLLSLSRMAWNYDYLKGGFLWISYRSYNCLEASVCSFLE